jgi:hypothetical protein
MLPVRVSATNKNASNYKSICSDYGRFLKEEKRREKIEAKWFNRIKEKLNLKINYGDDDE